MTSQLLSRVPLFAGLGPPQQKLIEERLQPVQFAASDALFRQGEPATRMLLIESGWVRLVTERGVALATLGPGSTVGDSDMLTGRACTTSAIAVDAVSAQSLLAADLERLVQADISLGIALSRAAGTPVAALRNYVLSRLQSVPGWRRVSRSALLAAEQPLTLLEASKGRKLYAAGDAPSALYIVDSGQVRLADPIGASGDITVGAGATFGDAELLTGKPATRTAEVTEPTVLWTLSAVAFAELTAAYPELRLALSQEVRAPLGAADQKAATERLRALPSFSRWPDDALEELTNSMLLQHVPAGEVVYHRGAAGDAMYLVDTGQVELQGDDEVLARVSAGNEFGEMALLTGRPRASTAVATADSNLWVLYRGDFDRLLTRYPAVQAALTETVAQRLASADEAFFDKHLRNISLLTGLSRPQLEAVRRRLHAARYRAGETIYRRGDEPEGMYLIERGEVRVNGEGAAGATMVEGSIFGEDALLLRGPRDNSARAVTDLDVWLLRREDFEDLMLQYPSLALNLSRVLEERLRSASRSQATAAAAATAVAATATTVAATKAAPATAPPRVERRETHAQPVSPATPGVYPTPQRVTTPVQASGINRALGWYQSAPTPTRILVGAVILLLVYLLGCALPWMLINTVRAAEVEARELSLIASLPVRGGLEVIETPAPPPAAPGVALAMINQDLAPTPTYTPWPTDTPLPTSTPTVTPTPTDTPIPTDTPLPTPTFAPAPVDTPVPAQVPAQLVVEEQAPQAVAAAAAAPAAVPAVEWRLVSARRLSACENRGNHHIFVTVLDVAGNPLDGVVLAQTASGSPAALVDRTVSGAKAPGKAEFVMWKGAEYMVFVAGSDGMPASTDLAQGLHSGFTDEEACAEADGGNTLFHNSFEVIFQRTS